MPAGELAGDSGREPLLLLPPGLEQLEHPDWETGGTERQRSEAVFQCRLAVLAETPDAFSECSPRDVDLHSDVGEADDLSYGSLPLNDGRRRITVVLGACRLLGDGLLSHSPARTPGPVPPSFTR